MSAGASICLDDAGGFRPSLGLLGVSTKYGQHLKRERVESESEAKDAMTYAPLGRDAGEIVGATGASGGSVPRTECLRQF